MIEFRDVEFAYRGKPLFTGLSFHLKRGEYLVISGAARSGKTTMVQLIAGLLSPQSGDIFLDGEPIDVTLRSGTGLRMMRRKIGGVGGIYSLLSDRTILENVALAAEIAGMHAPAARKKALEACARYRLSHVIGNFPDGVSEVERRGALLARAEAARKNLIVADSPTDGLDDESASYINDRLAGLRLSGVSILYLTSGRGPRNGPDVYLRFQDGKVEP